MKIDTAEFELSAQAPEQFLRDGLPEVAFAGRSNVGKSSLLNRLLGRKALARTSRTPGRTQAVNYFLVNRRLHFVDLPGYGYAKAARHSRRRWAALMDAYFRRSGDGRRTAGSRGHLSAPVLLVQLIDGKVGATDLDCEASRYFASLDLPTLTVATKIDRVPRGQRARNLAGIRRRIELPDSVELVAFSAVSGEGLGPLWRGITTFLEEVAQTGSRRPGRVDAMSGEATREADGP